MRTAFFVDGYNLYYGVLHGSSYKWLDLPALLQSILRVQDPESELASTAYFTAPVISRLASRGQLSHEAQDRYIRALAVRGVVVTLGQHRVAKGYAPHFVEGQPASRQNRVAVWEIEEKETDVNLALAMYRTASKASQLGIAQIVLVSGDTDLGPALSAIRDDFPDIRIGVILPHRQRIGEKPRIPPGSLQKHAHWMRRFISDEELSAHQLPRTVPQKTRKAIVKPDYW